MREKKQVKKPKEMHGKLFCKGYAKTSCGMVTGEYTTSCLLGTAACGSYLASPDVHGNSYFREVQKATICMFTGLYDENNNEVFEHDVLVVENKKTGEKYKGEVVLENGAYCVRWRKDKQSPWNYDIIANYSPSKVVYVSSGKNRYDDFEGRKAKLKAECVKK